MKKAKSNYRATSNTAAGGSGKGISSNTDWVGRMAPVPQVESLGNGFTMSNDAPHTMGVGQAAGINNVSSKMAVKSGRKGKAY